MALSSLWISQVLTSIFFTHKRFATQRLAGMQSLPLINSPCSLGTVNDCAVVGLWMFSASKPSGNASPHIVWGHYLVWKQFTQKKIILANVGLTVAIAASPFGPNRTNSPPSGTVRSSHWSGPRRRKDLWNSKESDARIDSTTAPTIYRATVCRSPRLIRMVIESSCFLHNPITRKVVGVDVKLLLYIRKFL